MAMASSQHTFLTNTLSPIFRHKKKKLPPLVVSCGPTIGKDDGPSGAKELGLAKLAIVTLAAGVLAFGSVHEASAAKTGGRVGGQAFRSAAPRPSAPRGNNNSRTNIYINPPVAPPLIGGYGYGSPFYGGGWGWSPFSFFAPGPSVAVGVGGGFEIFALLVLFGVVSTIIRRLRGPMDDEDDY